MADNKKLPPHKKFSNINLTKFYVSYVKDRYLFEFFEVSPIKRMLSKACNTDPRIQSALKHCNKEKNGEYFCTKVI